VNEMFFVPEDRLVQLASTRSGRISYAGYNYQCGYAVSRLVSMVTAKKLFGLNDYPKYIRYDWGEDLDEILQDDTVCFTQCKRVNDIRQPAKLAEVLMGFAPKWLWTPLSFRDRVCFRLVSCDVQFQTDFNHRDAKQDVFNQFKKKLKLEPSSKSDRFIWQKDVENVGIEALFDALWNAFSVIYIDSTVDADDPAGPVLWSEAAARDLLLRYGLATAGTQKAAIIDLRCLINESLIGFDPTNDDCPFFESRIPVTIDAADVRLALTDKRDHKSPPFKVVDRIVLTKARVQPKEKFLFESPEWHYLVHGTDKEVKFVEREQTDALRQKIRESLIKPLLSGTSNLPVLFVIGPPGGGKSTLVRRVAATLVECGEVVVADAGLNLAGGPYDLRSYSEDLQNLSGAGRPVLLILDDPLYDDSGWIDLLVYLKQPGFQLAVIAASPDFLYQQHHSQLTNLACSEFLMRPPNLVEKQRIAEVFDRDIKTFDDSDDFLVMIAEAESGVEFSRIMQRLWQTLNKGRSFDTNISFDRLPWQVRAFWFVCFIHRFYALCPLSNLKAALTLSGGTGSAIDVETALLQLKAKSGWSIFRHYSPPHNWTFEGDFVSTAHQKIASVAWEERPMQWFDSEVNRILAQSTIEEPQSIRNLAIAAGTMVKTAADSDVSFANSLIEEWKRTIPQQLEGRHVYTFVNMLRLRGGRELVMPMRETLTMRATGKDGWLFGLQLWFLSAEDADSGFFPPDIDLASLIAVADFSLAPVRAKQFFHRVARQPDLIKAVYSRLFESVEGRLDLEIDSELMTWMLRNAPQSDVANRLPNILNWIKRHDDDSYVLTQYLVFLRSLPSEFDQHRKQAVIDTHDWLKRHDEDSEVRTQYLTFLQSLPSEFDQHRKQAVVETHDWLKRHDEDSKVRTQYLTFLRSLPSEFDQQRKQAVIDALDWLKRHDEDSEVRTQYLTFLQSLPSEFDQQRKQAVIDTHEWLNRHDEDPYVRTQYLTFLQSLPSEFDQQRKQAAIDAHDWLNRHDENSDVRTQYLAFLQNLPSEFDQQRKQAATTTHDWLNRHNENSDVRTQYLPFLRSLPLEFDEQRISAAFATAAWLERHQDSVTVMVSYLAFLLDVKLTALEPLREDSDRYYQQLIARDPTRVGYNFRYGEQLARLSRFDEAAVQYKTVLNRHQGHQMARRGYAFALLKLGRIQEAEAEFKRALRWARIHKQSEAVFHTSLGEFYLEVQQWPDAISSFKEAQKQFPDHFRNHWGIARAHLGQGNVDEAENAIKLALKDIGLKPPAKEEIIRLHDDIRALRTNNQ